MASDGPPGTESLQSDLGPERIDRLKGYMIQTGVLLSKPNDDKSMGSQQMAKTHAGLPGPEMGARPPMMSAMPPDNPIRGMDPRGPLPPWGEHDAQPETEGPPSPGEDGRKEFPISWSSATVFKRI